MSENGQPVEVAPETLLAGHLVVLGLPDGTAILLFRPDGGGVEDTVQQPMPGALAGPLVSVLSGQAPNISGIPGAGLIQKVMMRGG